MKAIGVILGIVLGLAVCVLIYLPFMQRKCPFCKKPIPKEAHRCTHCFANLQLPPQP